MKSTAQQGLKVIVLGTVEKKVEIGRQLGERDDQICEVLDLLHYMYCGSHQAYSTESEHVCKSKNIMWSQCKLGSV